MSHEAKCHNRKAIQMLQNIPPMSSKSQSCCCSRGKENTSEAPQIRDPVQRPPCPTISREVFSIGNWTERNYELL